VLLTSLPGSADAWNLADARAVGWLWPPLASLLVVALALWLVLRAQHLRTISCRTAQRQRLGCRWSRAAAALAALVDHPRRGLL
jgi:hypothetical protein